jgi:hypothetical protein
MVILPNVETVNLPCTVRTVEVGGEMSCSSPPARASLSKLCFLSPACWEDEQEEGAGVHAERRFRLDMQRRDLQYDRWGDLGGGGNCKRHWGSWSLLGIAPGTGKPAAAPPGDASSGGAWEAS